MSGRRIAAAVQRLSGTLNLRNTAYSVRRADL